MEMLHPDEAVESETVQNTFCLQHDIGATSHFSRSTVVNYIALLLNMHEFMANYSTFKKTSGNSLLAVY